MKKNHMDHDYKATPFEKNICMKKLKILMVFYSGINKEIKILYIITLGPGDPFLYIHYKEWDEIIYPFKLQWYSH